MRDVSINRHFQAAAPSERSAVRGPEAAGEQSDNVISLLGRRRTVTDGVAFVRAVQEGAVHRIQHVASLAGVTSIAETDMADATSTIEVAPVPLDPIDVALADMHYGEAA